MEKLRFIAGWIDVMNDASVPVHSHKCYEMVYFRSGSATVNIGEKSYEAAAGSFFIISPGVMHNEVRHELGMHTVCMRFHGNVKFNKEFYTDYSGEFLGIIMSVINEYNNKFHKYKEIIDLRMRELLLLIWRWENYNGIVDNGIGYAVRIISSNYREKIAFRQLATSINMGYDRFRHKFKEITGYSPQSFLVKKRLEEATKLLCQSSLNCTEIAYYCGFSDSAQFTDMFKKQYGTTPKNYRISYKNKN